MAITKTQLATTIKNALDRHSDKEVDPAQARKEMADDLADAFAAYVVGRTVTVTGSSATGGPVTGTGIIQES